MDRSWIEFSVQGSPKSFEATTKLAVGEYRVAGDLILSKTDNLQIGLLGKISGRYQSCLSGERISLRISYDRDFASLLDSLPLRLARFEFQNLRQGD